MGGRLQIHLAFISFGVSFGKSQSAVKKFLTWQEMRQSLLPGETLHTIEPVSGVSEEEKEKIWISETGRFQICCTSAVPSGTIDIRPMQLSAVTSQWSVSVTAPDNRTGTPQDFQLELEEESNLLPEALWGKPEENLSVPKAGMIKGVTTYYIRTKAPQLTGRLEIPDYRETLVESLWLANPLTEEVLVENGDFSGDAGVDSIKELEKIAMEAAVARRQEVVYSLWEYYDGDAGDFSATQRHREELYVDKPRYRI